jgi:chaperonin GroES
MSVMAYDHPFQTAGGIFLPESTVSKANEGEVLALGSGIEMPLAVGDKVLLPDFGGLMLKLDTEEVFLFRADEILAKYSN